MIENNELVLSEIKNKIYNIRGVPVMLDRDLAEIYEVSTKALNQAIKRNQDKFPDDFCFQLSEIEKNELVTNCDHLKILKYSYHLSYVFTQEGVAMLSGVLKSKKASKMRAFVLMRSTISQNVEVLVRLNILERKSIDTETKIDKIFTLLENPNSKKNQGIFFNGQVFDSHIFISDLIKSAKSELILIDNYIDENTLNLFVKRSDRVKEIIYTKKITSSLKLDLEKYNSQYEPIEIKEFNLSHDRFLIIDKKEVYPIGASLKDTVTSFHCVRYNFLYYLQKIV